MLEIKGTEIQLTQGDDAQIAVVLETESGEYKLQTGDQLKMQVRGTVNTAQAVLTKTSTSSIINLSHSDTASVPSGLYLYQIQLQTFSGEIYTVVEGYFIITGDVVTNG